MKVNRSDFKLESNLVAKKEREYTYTNTHDIDWYRGCCFITTSIRVIDMRKGSWIFCSSCSNIQSVPQIPRISSLRGFPHPFRFSVEAPLCTSRGSVFVLQKSISQKSQFQLTGLTIEFPQTVSHILYSMYECVSKMEVALSRN